MDEPKSQPALEKETDHKMITLESLADGAAGELFGAALLRVLDNIQDLNTDWKPKRRIQLDVDFVSDESRQVGKIQISCSTKLAGMKGVETTAFIGKFRGQPMAVERPQQRALFPDQDAKPRAVPRAEEK